MIAQTLDIHSDACRDAPSSVWNLFHDHLSSHGVKFGKQSVDNGDGSQERERAKKRKKNYSTYSTINWT